MRISKFPPSRCGGCVTAPVKFHGLRHVCFFVFVVSSDKTSFKAIP